MNTSFDFKHGFSLRLTCGACVCIIRCHYKQFACFAAVASGLSRHKHNNDKSVLTVRSSFNIIQISAATIDIYLVGVTGRQYLGS